MASSPLNLKASYHVRSISLPSRSHPLTVSVEEQLYRLRSSEATSCSSSTCNNLSGLNSLYESVEDLLHLSLTQNALSKERSSKCVNDVLDGSLRLLDICSITRDVFLQIRECVQDLQSTLRRRKDTAVANEVALYMLARKKVSKIIQKCLGDLKKAENKNTYSSILNKDQNLVAIISVLREVESITMSMFKSLLSSVSSPKIQTKTTGWSLVSKLMHNKKSSQDIQVKNIEDIQKSLDSIQSSMKGQEDGLECIYKSLIKTRVSLLNILSQ
ncbi:Eukaryotic translation initiation factor 3 subunit a protein [Thalictrum thalictroides]|uniref:Eukaryotic translation initiation factor 3 subunit a protein n=1 Tax=Thalictrum thalictroides TaxID=46969 RepID=A0A7J6VAH9_THATH|nr:Eukaryotic translation initiation factor 3 subunit a protein [Thalictrum thalictroides]